MSDPIRVYADLYHQAVECRRRVDAIRNLLEGAVEALEKRPEQFHFDGLEAIHTPPHPGRAFANAADWPTAVQIQQVLADWHFVGVRLVEAWEALWPRDRVLLERSAPDSANIPLSAGYSRRAP